ncbi:MAG: hypothetical protein IJK69_05905 [Oscillospiraceae bacterium]|nr:hypothetical protein [Oscillospiraceae bacterium]
MSRRTADANRAIREAWEREKQLVLEGKGTRDWTPEQQQFSASTVRPYNSAAPGAATAAIFLSPVSAT